MVTQRCLHKLVRSLLTDNDACDLYRSNYDSKMCVFIERILNETPNITNTHAIRHERNQKSINEKPRKIYQKVAREEYDMETGIGSEIW